MTRALSSVPDHARGHLLLGYVEIVTSARRASPNLNMRWSWTEILPVPIPLLDLARFSSVAPKKRRPTLLKPCASVRATRWLSLMTYAGWAKHHLGSYEQAVAYSACDRGQPRNYPHSYFSLAIAIAQLDRLDEARSAVKAGLALNPSYSISRAQRHLDRNEQRPDLSGRGRARSTACARPDSRTMIAVRRLAAMLPPRCAS